jgi:hypothetical protein
MISPAAGAFERDPVDRVPARERTLELLFERLPQQGERDAGVVAGASRDAA